MANYPLELAQDAAYQSHTSRLTELWSLPRPAQGLNTYNNNNKYSTLNKISTAYTNSLKHQDTIVSGTNTLVSEVTRLYSHWIYSGGMSQMTLIFRHYQEKSMD